MRVVLRAASLRATRRVLRSAQLAACRRRGAVPVLPEPPTQHAGFHRPSRDGARIRASSRISVTPGTTVAVAESAVFRQDFPDVFTLFRFRMPPQLRARKKRGSCHDSFEFELFRVQKEACHRLGLSHLMVALHGER